MDIRLEYLFILNAEKDIANSINTQVIIDNYGKKA